MRRSPSAEIASAQFAAQSLAPAANLHRVAECVTEAHARGARLVVLPELINTGYCEHVDLHTLAEDRDGPTLRTFAGLSQRYGVYLAGGFVERHAGDVYNSLAFVTPRGEVSVYRKRHLIFWEHFYFRPGDRPLIVDTELGRIGFAICADLMYERIWSCYEGQIDLAVISAAWPRATSQTTGGVGWLLRPSGALACELPARVAQRLGCPVVFSNHCGPCEVRIPMMGPPQPAEFAGESAVYDARGIKLSASCDGEGLAMASLQSTRNHVPCATLSG